jgi:hypothetical protein
MAAFVISGQLLRRLWNDHRLFLRPHNVGPQRLLQVCHINHVITLVSQRISSKKSPQNQSQNRKPKPQK